MGKGHKSSLCWERGHRLSFLFPNKKKKKINAGKINLCEGIIVADINSWQDSLC